MHPTNFTIRYEFMIIEISQYSIEYAHGHECIANCLFSAEYSESMHYEYCKTDGAFIMHAILIFAILN